MEEYLQKVLEQIRCKQAKKLVEAELRGHLEEQIAENISSGMNREEAVYAAVQDMGNPVETGVSLDALHKPQICWFMVVMIGIISLLGIGVQTVIGMQNRDLGSSYIFKHVFCVLGGFCLMLFIYRLDYSFLGKHARILALTGGVLWILSRLFFSVSINGTNRWISLPGLGTISISALLYLAIPLYAGILYQYYGQGRAGVLKCILWLLLPVVLAFYSPNLFQAFFLFLVQSCLLTAAICKGWFSVKKGVFLGGFWGIALLLPVVFLGLGIRLHWFASYQTERILHYINSISLGFVQTTGQENPAYHNDLVFGFLGTSYGIMAAILVAALLLALSMKGLHMARKQKNELGTMVGYAGGLFFLFMTLLNILMSVGILPGASSFLPLISSGGSNLFLSYMVLGLLLSVYRYQNLLPTDRKKLRKTSGLLET